MSAPAHRDNNFNILRFAAAALVVYGHMFPLMGLPGHRMFGTVSAHGLGLRILFLLSGYLIRRSWQRDPCATRYAARRALRIWPALIVLCLLTALVMGPLVSNLPWGEYISNPGAWKYIGKNILLWPEYGLPGVFAGNAYGPAVNGSLWSLPVEAALYIVLPVLLKILRGPKAQRIGLACAAAACCAARLACIVMPWHCPPALQAVHYFFIGALFSFPEVKPRLNTQWALAALLVLAALPAGELESELFSILLLPYAVFSFALPRHAAFARAFSKNDYSYGLYLYAFPVQQLLSPWLVAHNAGPRAGALLAFAVTLPLAVGSWHLIEKHAQRLAKKLTDRKQSI
ncbi:MAG: acyltransferase [Firmicutes bacterium]|nr:acyltransferase [Bacillota bacterium]